VAVVTNLKEIDKNDTLSLQRATSPIHRTFLLHWLCSMPCLAALELSEYFGRMMKSFAFACDIFCAYIVVPMIREPLRVCKGFPAYTISFSPPSLSSEFQHESLEVVPDVDNY
jgi:hypothetical protein